jgi:two-component system cell cycle sensor histidine kinase/response regulator CckA
MNNNDKFNLLFESMIEGVALHHYIKDDSGLIIDYLIDDVNPAFEKILKLKRAAVVGKKATEVYGVSEPPYLKEYTNLKKGEPRQFEVFFAPLKKYFSISVSPWGDNGFTTIFFDITDRKKIDEELKNKNLDLERMNNIMIDRELKMVSLKEEIKKHENKK